jgi:hypothetical protein
MVLKWRREAGPGWQVHAAWNALGAALTGIVLVVVAVTKFAEGAWIIVAIIPVLVLHFRSVHRHYQRVADQLSLAGYAAEPVRHHTGLVPVSGVHRAVLEAIGYARSLSGDVQGLYGGYRGQGGGGGGGVPLVVLSSPYRSLLEPLLEHIEQVQETAPGFITVVLPEFVPARWWHHLLHNQSALLIKAALLFRRDVVVTSVPFHLAR